MTKIGLSIAGITIAGLLFIVVSQNQKISELNEKLDFAGKALAKEMQIRDNVQSELYFEHLKKLKHKA